MTATKTDTPTPPATQASSWRHATPWAAGVPGPIENGAARAAVRPAAAAANGALDLARKDLPPARLLVTDVRVALLLLKEARHRAIERLFGVPRDQSWIVALIALGLIGQAAHRNADRLLRGSGGPSGAEVMLGVGALRALVTGISGPQSRDTELSMTLVSIAVVGALLRPALSRSARTIRASSRRVRLAFDHRYGHLIRGSQPPAI